MDFLLFRRCAWAAFMILILTIGCSGVNPKAEYERARQQIAANTGRKLTRDPEESWDAGEQVAARLAGGLTLQEAAELALLNNPEFLAAWAEIGMSKADLVQSSLLSNPTLGGALRMPAGGGLANLEMNIAQNIADLWQIPARRRSAKAVLDRTILQVAWQAAVLAAQAQEGYFRAVGARETNQIAVENHKVATQLVEMTTAKQKAGAGTNLDVNLARSAMIESELTVESTRLAQAEALRSLARTLGLTSNADSLVLVDEFPNPQINQLDPDRIIAIALQQRPDLKAAYANVTAAKAEVELQWRRVFPVLELGAAFERVERQRQGGRDVLADTARASIANGSLTAPEIQPRSARRQSTDFIIGPSWSMELPLFDQNQAQIAKANYAYRQAADRLDAVEREVSQDVRGAVDQMKTAWKIVGTYEKSFIPLAQQSLDLSRVSYQAGQASFLSVLEAQRLYLDTRRRSSEAAQAAAVTTSSFERIVGMPFPRLREALSAEASTQPSQGGTQ